MEVYPHAWLFFVPFILVSAFVMLNLFVAVIVDTMANLGADGEETDKQAGLEPKTANYPSAKTKSNAFIGNSPKSKPCCANNHRNSFQTA